MAQMSWLIRFLRSSLSVELIKLRVWPEPLFEVTLIISVTKTQRKRSQRGQRVHTETKTAETATNMQNQRCGVTVLTL